MDPRIDRNLRSKLRQSFAATVSLFSLIGLMAQPTCGFAADCDSFRTPGAARANLLQDSTQRNLSRIPLCPWLYDGSRLPRSLCCTCLCIFYTRLRRCEC